MNRMSEQEIEEQLEDLVRMTPHQLGERFDEATRHRIEESLETHRSLQRTSPSVLLPVDFAVRVAEEAGALRPASRRFELWLAAAAVLFVLAAELFLLGLVSAELVGRTTDLVFVVERSRDIVVGGLAGSAALVAVAWIDRRRMRG